MIEIDKVKSSLEYLVVKVHDLTSDYLEEEKLSMIKRGCLAEAYLALEALLKNNLLIPHEYVIIRRDMSQIYNEVYSEEALFYYSSFYYAKRKINEGAYEAQIQFQKINLDIIAMLIKVKAISHGDSDLDSSTDNYFFSRMGMCTDAFEHILANEIETYYVPSLYCLANMMQVLLTYVSVGKSKYEEKIIPLLQILSNIIYKFKTKLFVVDILNSNYQLQCFMDNQLQRYNTLLNKRYNIDINVDGILRMQNTEFLRVLTNINNIDHDNFISLFEMKFNEYYDKIEIMKPLDVVLFLRLISEYLLLRNPQKMEIEFNLYEKIKSIDTEDFLNQVFALNRINLSEVTQYDIEKIMKMKDDELRLRFAKTIKGVSERVLQREATKPHGVVEISDMELPVEYRGSKYYLCMPFKSGVEIKGKTVPVEVAYQIVRPFIEFRNCIVVFVTAKKCSESLMNYIKKLKDKMEWPIEVIEEGTLAGLLAMNNQL